MRYRSAQPWPWFVAVWCAGAIGATAVAAPPRVIRATPDLADQAVDPALSELRIEFDQDMVAGSHSICGGGEAFPTISGKVRWESPRICVVPVTLKPGHAYTFSINCRAARGFKSVSGESAEVYPISFRTRSAGAPTPAPLTAADKSTAIATLRKALAEKYSYIDVHKVDWDAVFAEAAPRIEAAESPGQFARVIASALANADDLHIGVRVGDIALPVARRDIDWNINLDALPRVVPGVGKKSDVVWVGSIKPQHANQGEIGYILIRSWSGGEAAISPALAAIDSFKDAPGIVIDVRPNGGGDELLARAVAARFTSARTVYSRSVFRDPASATGFTEPIDRSIEPAAQVFPGRVAVLMGPINMSSNESFLLMMRYGAGNRARLFGEKSFGSSGNPKPLDLGHGITVTLPSWKDLFPDGTLLEGRGIDPDEKIAATPAELQKGDPILAAAIAWIRGSTPAAPAPSP